MPHVTAFLLASLQAAALTLAPHGGQQVARRNAWAAMAADAARARARREVAEALAATAAAGTGVGGAAGRHRAVR